MKLLLVNNLGTVLYTIVFGKKVGEDNLGNTYYISKKKDKRKWVIYKDKKDPTIIPVNWQIWLTNTDDEIIQNKVKYNWVKDRERNLTGTDKAYYPTNDSLIKLKTKKKYKKWDPN